MESFSSLAEDFPSPSPFEDFVTDSDNVSYHVMNMTSNLGPVRDPLYIVIPITILYAVIFFTGVVGNVVTCIVISRNKHMHTATNYYLFSLAVSDLLLLVSGLPQEMYFVWSRYPYVFGEVFCVLRGLAAETSANATVLTITAFTVERYVAICHPFLSHTMSKLSRAIKLIVVIWVVALGFAIPQAIQFGIIYGANEDDVQCLMKKIVFSHSFELSTFLFFVTPMTLITVLYALIGMRLRRSSMVKQEAGSFSCKHTSSTRKMQSCCRHQQSQSSRRVLKMLVAVVVAFFICWAPFHAQRLIAIYNIGSRERMMKIYGIVTYISGILYYVSTTINPILYHTMSLKFREAFKDTIARCCGFKGHRTRRSYSILSRSAQRGPVGASNAGQESTDYSGNSVREEVLAASRGSGAPSVKKPEVNWVTQQNALNKNKKGIWKVLSFVKSADIVVDDNRILSVSYSPTAANQEFKLNKETFGMKPVCRSNSIRSLASSSNNVSNSSLRDVERGALEDELTAYMQELRQREDC